MPSRFLARNVARVCLPCDAHRIHTGHSRVCGVVPDIISGMISFALTGGCGGAWDKLRAWISRVLEESATVVPGNPPVGTVECLRRPGHGKWRGLQPSALTSHASDALPGRASDAWLVSAASNPRAHVTRGRTSLLVLVRVMGEKLEEEKERGKGGGGRYMARRAGAEGDEGALSQRSVRERP